MIGKPTILRHQNITGCQVVNRCINSGCNNHVSCKIAILYLLFSYP
jgi:hypothetical protein